MPAPLVYFDDSQPGITRELQDGHWRYFAPDGSEITDEQEIARLNAIRLPPAYANAWFAPRPDAHILARGYDARGRKQYRYHPEFRREREERKFELCAAFGRSLPVLRERVSRDLGRHKLTRERAVASVVRLLDTGQIRVGNECYARTNKTFGATTLRMRHVRLKSREMVLRFKGKSGKIIQVRCTDTKLIRFVRKMQDLPGQHLFQYIDEAREPSPIGSGDVNSYLRETMGAEFTARNFRTWAASVTAFAMLWHDPTAKLGEMLAVVAERLGNTPAIARKSYIHPAIIAAATDRSLREAHMPLRLPRQSRWLSREERGLLLYLESLDAAAASEPALLSLPR